MIHFRMAAALCLVCLTCGVAIGQYFNPWWILPAPAHKRRKAAIDAEKQRLRLIEKYGVVSRNYDSKMHAR